MIAPAIFMQVVYYLILVIEAYVGLDYAVRMRYWFLSFDAYVIFGIVWAAAHLVDRKDGAPKRPLAIAGFTSAFYIGCLALAVLGQFVTSRTLPGPTYLPNLVRFSVELLVATWLGSWLAERLLRPGNSSLSEDAAHSLPAERR
jgi:hypothetical protein